MSKYPPVYVGADTVVLSKDKTEILLILRKHDPFKDCWAFPGGFFDVVGDDDIWAAAIRELKEETTVQVSREQLRLISVFSKKARDPREITDGEVCRIFSVAFLTQIDKEKVKIQAQDDAKDIRWFPLAQLPALGFDHSEILQKALLLP